jgi:hypothetical protein
MLEAQAENIKVSDEPIEKRLHADLSLDICYTLNVSLQYFENGLLPNSKGATGDGRGQYSIL